MEKYSASKVKSRQDKPAPSQMDGNASGAGRGGTDIQLRHEKIAEAAYYLAEKRGFAPGKELDDWHEAEARIDQYATSRDVTH